jgi:hypothetical protein
MLRFVVFLAFFAAVVYAFFWLLERRNHGGGGGTRPAPRGPVGPDDDEDFLRKLDWEQRRTRHPGDEDTT